MARVSFDISHIAVYILWGTLGAGFLLSLIGLRHSSERFWHWRRVRQIHAGEIIAAEGALEVGQEAALLPASLPVDATENALYSASIVEVGKQIVLRLEREVIETLAQVDALRPTPGALAGVPLAVQIRGASALYRFEALVCRVDSDKTGQKTHCLVTLKRPLWLARIQRRNYLRTQLTLPVDFQLMTETAGGKLACAGCAPVSGTLIDLSGGGLCANVGSGAAPSGAAAMMRNYPPGSILLVRHSLPLLSQTPLYVRVLKRDTVIVRGGLGMQIACAFLPMKSWEQDILVQQVFRAHREQLRSASAKPIPA